MFNEFERYWGVMKKSFGMFLGVNIINLVVIEGGCYFVFIVDECWLWIIVYYLLNESYEFVVNEIEWYLNKVVEVDVWFRENLFEFEWGGIFMIEDKGEIFLSFIVLIYYLGFK